MRVLILGGTKFLGRHLVDAALARKHQVTLFNRQQTNPSLFPGVEKLRGDRKSDLQALHNGTWDAVIDTSGQSSPTVRASAQLLASRVGHYTFVSTASVYSDFSIVGLDESASVEVLPNGKIEDENDSSTYGARKALCEQAAEAAMPGRVLNVRPGIIVGPHDPTGRFLYWVLRAAAGGRMLGPGKPDALVQLLDARDLSEWLIRIAEAGTTGTYNAKGPVSPLTFGPMLEQCVNATRSGVNPHTDTATKAKPGGETHPLYGGRDAHRHIEECASRGETRITWVDDQFLLERNVQPFSDLPFWLPIDAYKGFFAVNCRRAFAAGLTCRPLTETVADTLRWSRDENVRSQIGLPETRERELLKAWEHNFCRISETGAVIHSR